MTKNKGDGERVYVAKKGDLITKDESQATQKENLPVTHTIPTTSLTTSWVEQQRLKQLRNEEHLRQEVIDQKTELNASLINLAESEVYKEVALDRLRNIDTEKQRLKKRRDVEEETTDIERNTDLIKARGRLEKAKRKLKEQKAQRKGKQIE